MPLFDQVIVWIVVGLIGGSLAGLLITWEKQGFGWGRNLGLGLAGALVGGFLFRLLGLFPGLDTIAISLGDIVAAVVGSLIVLGALWLWQTYRAQWTVCDTTLSGVPSDQIHNPSLRVHVCLDVTLGRAEHPMSRKHLDVLQRSPNRGDRSCCIGDEGASTRVTRTTLKTSSPVPRGKQVHDRACGRA